MENILVALIGLLGSVLVAFLSYRGVVSAEKSGLETMLRQLELHQAVTDEKIATLTREVREHNGFARRMPVIEERLAAVERKGQE